MALAQLTSRQQTIVLFVIGGLLAGAYGVMRYMPQQKIVSDLSQKLTKTKAHIQAPVFPEPPDEDSAELKAQSGKLESVLDNLQTELDVFEQNLAPTDSQTVLLKISEAARAANVKFIENVPYIVARRLPVDTTSTQNLSKRQQKKLAKKLRKQNKNTQTGAAAVGAIPKEGELLDRLVNNLDEARPLQRVSVEGNFENLLKFIQSVQALPWQVTIVKLDIDVNMQAAPQGYPQPLLAKMIIAM